MEYCDLGFSTSLTAESGNVKDKAGVYYCGNPNNQYLIAHHYEKVAGEAVTLNENCKIVQNEVFENYEADLLILSDKLTQIGDSAFENAKLQLLELPDSVKYIGSNAFKGCTMINNIVKLPSSIEKIATNAFANQNIPGTESGRCIYLGTSENPHYYLLRAKQYGQDEGLNPDIETDGYVIHEDTKIIAEDAFLNSSIIWDSTLSEDPEMYIKMGDILKNALAISVPDGIEAIGRNALYCDEHILRSVSLPGNWPTLHDDADNVGEIKPLSYYLGNGFSEPTGLEEGQGVSSVIIREGYKNVAYGAFANLGTLNELILPQSLVSTGADPLGDTKVYSLTIPYGGSGLAPENVKHLTVVGDGETVLNASSFSYSDIESVTLKGIEQISGYAFNYANKLKTVTMSADVKRISASAFSSCYSLTDIYFEGTKEQWATIHKGENWNYNTGNYIVHCSNGDISKN